MNYNFTYKSQFERRSFNQRINKIASDFVFYLYNNWLFKKLNLDKNEIIKYSTGREHKIKPSKSSIPDDPNLYLHSITYTDCYENEDTQSLKNQLLRIISKYERSKFFSEDPVRKLNKVFSKFESSYKSISQGNFYYNTTKDNDELDLIDAINYGYIKGLQSNFIITYTIFPSTKFNDLFKESLKAQISEEPEIMFKSFAQIIKTKKLFNGVATKVKRPGFWTEKLINEISYQFKSKVLSDLDLGAFINEKKILFPRMICFEYDPAEFKNYEDDFFSRFEVMKEQHYHNVDTIFTLKNVDFSRSLTSSLEMLIPKISDDEKKDQFNNISYLSENFISGIAPYWTLINLSILRKPSIVDFRKRTFVYIRKNKVSLFLKKVIRLKNKLSLEWISFERIRKDFTSDIFKRQLNYYGVPDAFNTPVIQGTQPNEFKYDLEMYSEYVSTDIKETYEDILKLYRHIGEDYTLRANMGLQKLLFWIAIAGIILTVYGTNSDWFNSWFEYYLNKWGIEIPIAPIMTSQ